ncbi:EF-P 5-aminopentanol modification-associated protein YfmH [Streptococcus sp. zg-JUN1979]|uniref:EF-P 5-aminopentanol modification-associated protein YfmH n=1 Tax=Streptococcus sp. zg-JUN1979 TaxID=3391450 RepID=UPI0039A6AF24
MVTLDKRVYTESGEVSYQAVLDNGLQLVLIPKKEGREVTALMSVQFGSVDTAFSYEGVEYAYPAGHAHFLEHKMFEAEDGSDVSLSFSQLGTDCNAYTNFAKTAYFFSATDNLDALLPLLVSFVETASFTDESIEREKEIIKQEIKMYQDDPDSQLYQTVLASLFPGTPLAVDVAGDVNTIRHISKDDLVNSHRMFYQPSNCRLILVGCFNPYEVIKAVSSCQKADRELLNSPVIRQQIAYQPVIPKQTLRQSVTTPKLAVAYRGLSLDTAEDNLYRQLVLKIYLAMILGWTSEIYQVWYDNGLIDDSFDMEVEVCQTTQFIIITGDTKEPIGLATRIKRFLAQSWTSKDLNQEQFQLVCYELYSEYLRSLDNTELLASQLSQFVNYLDFPTILKQLTLEDVVAEGRGFFETADVVEVTMLPK